MTNPVPNSSSSTNSFIALITVGLLQSVAYYTFLAVFVLYLIDSENGLNIGFEEVGPIYSLSKYAMIFGLILAGPLMDFVLKNRKTLNLGFLILFSGYLMLLIPDKGILNVSLVVMGLGTGMTRVGMYSHLAGQLALIPSKRDSGFVAFSIIFNIGGAASSVLILWFNSVENFRSTFLICALFSLLAFGVSFFFLRGNHIGLDRAMGRGIKGIIAATFIALLAFAFWSIYGIFSNDLYRQVDKGFSESGATDIVFSTGLLQGLSSWLVIGLSLVLLLVLYFAKTINAYKAIIIAVLLLAITTFGLYIISPLSTETSLLPLFLVLFLAALAEIIFAPFSINYLTKYSPAKLSGCFIALYLVGIQCSLMVGGLVDHGFEESLTASKFTLLAGRIALALIVPMIILFKYFGGNEATTEAAEPPHLPE